MYCEVIVDITASAVDRLYTYRIPDGMRVEPGMLLRIPFGPRHIEGYAISVISETDLAEEKIRDIAGLAQKEPVILPELMALARFMVKEYYCTMADCLRLFLPAQMRGGRVREKQRLFARRLVEGEALAEAVRSLRKAPVQADMLQQMVKPVQVALLEAKKPGIRSSLKGLEKKGYIIIEEQRIFRKPHAEAMMPDISENVLTSGQKNALERILEEMKAPRQHKPFLLHGVTGSGKTEVYIRAVQAVLAKNRTAIVLVPEISLTPQMVDWFQQRFHGQSAVLHSRLSAGERFDEWQRICSGDAQVVIGARSAIFAPLRDIGIIIIDEEHEASYNSESHVRYDAREIAKWRAAHHEAPLVMGSATPSVQSFLRAQRGEYQLLDMPQRANTRPLPEVRIVDMRRELAQGNRTIFSSEFASRLGETIKRGDQALLFLNRRGHSSFISCRACGKMLKCDNCDITLTYHVLEDRLKCHYCDREYSKPKTCPSCGSEFLKYFGAGTQKIEQEVMRVFPGTRVLRMDADTTRGKDMHHKLLASFRRGEAQVLVGTQMIAKGLDFPNVTMVGLVAADASLGVNDYRAEERTFQLITQVAGRAGRADKSGIVVLQTYEPDHYAVKTAARQDYRAFYFEEIERRRRALYPPYTVVCRILVTGKDQGEAVLKTAEEMEDRMREFFAQNEGYYKDIVQMRAMEAPIGKINDVARAQLFLKLYNRRQIRAIFDELALLAAEIKQPLSAVLEINPPSML